MENKGIINEHDNTVKMLNYIRENKATNRKIMLNEQDSTGDSVEVNGDDAKSEYKSFTQIVTPRVEFKSFNVYPNDNNVVLSGILDIGVNFQMSKRDGLYINADNLKLDVDTVEIFKKLNAYYNNWVDSWSQKLAQDYHKTM